MKALTFAGVALALLASTATAATSGLRGIVTRGPITPVCTAGRPCSAPAKDIKLTFTRDGHSWTTKTDKDGRYRIELHPGTYTVTVPGQRPILPDWHAVVPHGRIATHNFEIDTGIR